MNTRKGQIEFAFVVILVILGLVVAYMFIGPVKNKDDISSDKGTNVVEETKNIRDSVKNLAKKGLAEKLDKIYMQGGYANPINESVKVGLYKVAILYNGSGMKVIDFRSELADELEDYMKEHLEERMDFFGKDVFFNLSSAAVKISIQKGHINARINLPTEVDGFNADGTYDISIPSDLFDIMNFTRNFLYYQNQTRFLEMSIIDAMARSNPGSEYWIPIDGVVDGCEITFFRNKERLLQSFEKLITYQTSHIFVGNSSNMLYSVPIDADIETAFIYPEWLLSDHFSPEPDPSLSQPERLSPLSSYCISYYNISYSFSYPVIVYARDEPLDKWFRFAVMVNVKGNAPSPDASSGIKSDKEYYNLCRKMAKCPVKIKVETISSIPVENAIVMFDRCVVDYTNEEGTAEGFAPCFAGELTVRKEGMEPFRKFTKSDDLNGVKVVIPSQKITEIKLYGVPMEHGAIKSDVGTYESYDVADAPMPLDEFPGKYMIFGYIYPLSFMTSQNFIIYNTDGLSFTDHAQIRGLAAGKFNLIAIATDNETGNVVGYINTTFSLSSSKDELYLYMPILLERYPEYEPMRRSLYPDEITKVTKALIDADIMPLSFKKQEIKSEEDG